MGVFNAAAYLEAAIDSILGQTLRDFEFIIVDDASTDASLAIVERFAAQDRRIRILRNDTNQGLGVVLHRGVAEARGEFVARMDADDVAMPERLEKQLRYFHEHPDTDVLGSYAMDIDEHGRDTGERRVPTAHARIVALMWSNPLIHPTVMFRRQRVVEAGSYSPAARRRQDYDLWFRCARHGLRFANLPEPLLRYRFSQNTLRRNDLRAMWQQVRVGWQGCRMTAAPPLAYLAVGMPLVEAMLPSWLRLRLAGLKRRLDPRNRA